MLNKKSIELSLNFIIIIILSIIIFGFGVRFISKLASEAEDLTKLTFDELDDRIGDLVCEGSDRVCIGIDRKTIRRKELNVFGVKIINILPSQNFDIIISPSSPFGYKKDRTPITTPSLVVSPRARNVRIEQNEEKNIGIGVQVPANAESGTYILNVEIKMENGQQYTQMQKIYVEVP